VTSVVFWKSAGEVAVSVALVPPVLVSLKESGTAVWLAVTVVAVPARTSGFRSAGWWKVRPASKASPAKRAGPPVLASVAPGWSTTESSVDAPTAFPADASAWRWKVNVGQRVADDGERVRDVRERGLDRHPELGTEHGIGLAGVRRLDRVGRGGRRAGTGRAGDHRRRGLREDERRALSDRQRRRHGRLDSADRDRENRLSEDRVGIDRELPVEHELAAGGDGLGARRRRDGADREVVRHVGAADPHRRLELGGRLGHRRAVDERDGDGDVRLPLDEVAVGFVDGDGLDDPGVAGGDLEAGTEATTRGGERPDREQRMTRETLHDSSCAAPPAIVGLGRTRWKPGGILGST
jgi:hypothetical protein